MPAAHLGISMTHACTYPDGVPVSGRILGALAGVEGVRNDEGTHAVREDDTVADGAAVTRLGLVTEAVRKRRVVPRLGGVVAAEELGGAALASNPVVVWVVLWWCERAWVSTSTTILWSP